MEMVAGSFGSEVRCRALCPALPAPFHLPLQAAIAAASPARTRPAHSRTPARRARPDPSPLSLSCAGHELRRALLGPNSLPEWLWVSVGAEFAFGYCCPISPGLGPRLLVCKVS